MRGVDELARALEAMEEREGPFERCLGVDDLRGEGRGLWFLATQVLNYDLLTDGFHRPMLREWDLIDRRRARGEQVDTLDLWPRDHYKTWCLRARAVRRYMRNPRCTQTWWHAVEEMAEESGVAVGKMLQSNKELRRISRGGRLALPSTAARKFVTAKGFRLPANDLNNAPSMRTAGAGTEVTGGHSDFGMLDDPIGLNDVLNNQMAAKRQWYRGTVRNVLRSDGSLDGIGTRWAEDDLYSPWLKSALWVSVVRACLEKDGKPDYDGDPVLLTREQIERKREELGELMFALQMMNDASPKADRPWKASRESLLIGMEERGGQFGAGGPGVCWVVSDPAPAVIGSSRGRGEKKRGDGSKDEWATATIKFRNFNGLIVAILMELTASRDWTVDEGLDEICRQMSRWKTPRAVPEFTNYDWTPEMRKASRRNGVPLWMDKNGALPRFKSSYAHGSKNVRFGMLASWAESGRFFICEDTVDPEVLERLFGQLEFWRPLPGGDNTLPHDDLADVVSRATDPLLASWTPPEVVRATQPLWSPFKRQDENEGTQGVRHIRW